MRKLIQGQSLIAQNKADSEAFSARLALSAGFKHDQWLFYGSAAYKITQVETEYNYDGFPEESIDDTFHMPSLNIAAKFQTQTGFYFDLGFGVNYVDTKRSEDKKFEPTTGIRLGWVSHNHKSQYCLQVILP